MASPSSTVPAVSTAIGGASKTTSSHRLRSTGQNASSKSAKKASKPSKRSPIAPTVDELWINGQCPQVKSLLAASLNESIGSILTINDLSLNAVSLLHILNCLSLYWYDLYVHTNAMCYHQNISFDLTGKHEFYSSKLTSKVHRQLQDPVVIMMSQIPSWISELGYRCSFLFAFETRQMIFSSCAFDRERAIQRLSETSDMFTHQQHQQHDQADRQSMVSRIERKKVQLSREEILPEMEKVLENWNLKQFLEVQYENEVGDGRAKSHSMTDSCSA